MLIIDHFEFWVRKHNRYLYCGLEAHIYSHMSTHSITVYLSLLGESAVNAVKMTLEKKYPKANILRMTTCLINVHKAHGKKYLWNKVVSYEGDAYMGFHLVFDHLYFCHVN